MNRINQTARTLALRALLQMEKSEGYSNIILDRALASSNLNSRDKALSSTIFYGVLERLLTLDFFIGRCLRDPGKKVEPTAMWALRCGAYQILYLDRVPDSAAVNETVNAVKAIGKPQLAGFVNGVLRGLLRKKGEITLPGGEDAQALSLRYSIPENLIRLWQHSYGEEMARRLLDSMVEKPPLYIRINTIKNDMDRFKAGLEPDSIKLLPVPGVAGAALLEGCGTPTELPQFKKGLFHVQDLSAQLVCKLLAPQPGETICDCCAAPGGKTFTLAQGVGETGKIYSTDLYESRARLIRSGAKRLGLNNIEAWANDALNGFGEMPQVDKMLCDVPCSGFGVIRRKPEIRYRNLETIKTLPDLQYRILQQAARKVRTGGMLVYSTCTLNPAENGQVAERFLKESNGFIPMKIQLEMERWVKEPEYVLTMAPFAGASDGFFAAAFQKI